jgi:hypothetical protein
MTASGRQLPSGKYVRTAKIHYILAAPISQAPHGYRRLILSTHSTQPGAKRLAARGDSNLLA